MTRPLFTCVGINHNTSPVEERERLAFTRTETITALHDLEARLPGAALLSTCNRTELYTVLDTGRGVELIGILTELKDASIDERHFYVLQDAAAVEHLYRVASGIDSMVLGESQILGQVRDALSAATAAGSLNGGLSHLLHTAIRVGKRARTETDIDRHAVSVGSAAVALARHSLGDLEDRTVLVISAGSMGKIAAKALAQQTGSRILVANRTQDRAEALAEHLGPGTVAFAFDELQSALIESDIVISGTGSEGFILGPEEIRSVMEARSGRGGLLFIDIAVPRDIHPAVRDIEGVHLCDIDDIEAITREGWTGRQAQVEKVEAIIAEEVAAFEEWWASLDIVPVISALRDRAEAIRGKELARALEKMPDLDDDSRDRIEAMTQAIVKKMLDRPIARLKDGADKALYIKAIEDLFDARSAPRRGPRP